MTVSALPSPALPEPVTAARIGIGGPVGSGKTALIERLIPALQARGVDLAVVTNDLVTKEDAERLRRSGLIDPARVEAVEAGACIVEELHDTPYGSRDYSALDPAGHRWTFTTYNPYAQPSEG